VPAAVVKTSCVCGRHSYVCSGVVGDVEVVQSDDGTSKCTACNAAAALVVGAADVLNRGGGRPWLGIWVP